MVADKSEIMKDSDAIIKALELRNNDAENPCRKKTLKYPRSVFFIISNEFCERFNYYGLRTILTLYLTRELDYNEDDAIVIYHTFTMFVYFLCLFGAILSDSWLGKFKTIFWLSLVYVVGNIFLTLGSVAPLNLPPVTFTMLGLALIALGSGGIKPCVSAFGGDQFKLPEQLKQMATFFSIFYFAINSGSFISSTVTPILRSDVHCFGQSHCYPLAFGLPAILMITSIAIFVAGKFLYISKPPAGNMLVTVSKCIVCAISNKCKTMKIDKKDHWLDYAEVEYDKQTISDIKVLFRVLVLYIPLPLFWALFDQQGSRWTLQATHMNGDMGSWDIKPDQVQMINPLLILAFIPLYEALFYPLLSKIGIRRPLQKLTLGGIFAGIAFVISGFVELQLEKSYPVLPNIDNTQLRIFNGIPDCNYSISIPLLREDKSEIVLNGISMFEEKFIKSKDQTYEVNIKSNDTVNCPALEENWILSSHLAYSVYLKKISDNEIKAVNYEDHVEKPSREDPLIRLLSNVGDNTVVLKKSKVETIRHKSSNTSLITVPFGKYDVEFNGERVFKNMYLGQGGVYTLVIQTHSHNNSNCETRLFEITESNSVSILWLIPQYVIMTLGEVMFSVTGLEFSYAQAPLSMKSVLQACFQLTVAFGNVIVVIIAEAKIFDSQASEFFLFAGLMFVDMVAFGLLAYKYKPNNSEQSVEKSEDTTSKLPETVDFVPLSKENESNEFTEMRLK